MTEFVLNWMRTVSVTAIAGSVICFLVPKGNMEKALKTVVSFSLLFALMLPLFGVAKPEFSDKISLKGQGNDIVSDYGNDINRSLKEKYAEVLKNTIEKLLKENGIDYSRTEVYTDIDGDGRIFIKEITVFLNKENLIDISETAAKIKEVTGNEAKFITENGE